MQYEENKANKLKIALVHDFLVQYGGAERFLEVLAEMFPDSPIYTLLYDKEKMGDRFEGREIRTSYLQKFPRFLRKRYQWLLPFLMVAPETFDLRDFDLVISSSGAWAKGIITRLNTTHIAYLHSPMRFVWEITHNAKRITRNGLGNFFVRFLLNYVRMWDKLAAERPDYLISNSKYTQERVKKYYRRESAVIYPPAFSEAENNFQFPIPNFQSNSNDQISNDKKNTGYFLIVSRLSPYKKVDLAVEAFNKLGLPLVIIGEGKQRKYLEKIARDNIKILGWVSDDKLGSYYAEARAFIFPADDDFGLTIVEAMGHGVPAIAYKKGGALEIIEEGKTGEFFEAQTPEVLADGVRRFMENEGKYSRENIINRAREFSKDKFKIELEEFINKIIQEKNLQV
jgi:glycosyltransferase involved in cell wall biosynthesis